jgi:hypothetical protein
LTQLKDGPAPEGVTPDMDDRKFIFANLRDLVTLARDGGRAFGHGVVIIDRRPKDHYDLRFLALADFCLDFPGAIADKAASQSADIDPRYPEMGFLLLLIRKDGMMVLMLLVPPTWASTNPTVH